MKRIVAMVALVLIALGYTTAAAQEPVGAPATVQIPATITSDCSKDVTTQVTSFVGSIPPGGTGQLSPGGCYQVNQKLSIGGVTLDGRGATIRKTVQETACKLHAGLVKLGTGGQLANVTLERVGGPGGYDPCHYAEHGVEIIGSSNTAVSNVTENRVRGDCLYLQGVDGVLVRDLKCLSNGRQGGAISRGSNVKIDGFTVGNSARSGFDFEANGVNDGLSNIEIGHFDITAGLIAFPSQGYASAQDGIYLHDGIVRSALSFVYDRQTRPSSDGCRAGGTRKNWRVENVQVDPSVGAYGPGSAVFCGTENVTFRGVKLPGGNVVFEASRGTLIAADSCVKEVRTVAGTVPVQQSNITAPPCGGAPPSSSTTTTSAPVTTQPATTTTTTTTTPPAGPTLKQVFDQFIAYCNTTTAC